MSRLRNVAFVAMIALCSAVAAHASDTDPGANPASHPWCGTDVISRQLALQRARFGMLGSCAPYGPCDVPSERDGTPVRWINVRAIVHVFRHSDGTGGASTALVDETIAQINADLRATRSGFRLEVVAVRTHDDDFFYCIPACQPNCDQAFGVMDLMRQTYAEDPAFHCNVYLSCMADNSFGGVGSFPFFGDATGKGGGFWLNTSTAMGTGNHIPVHELGHTLGLWHTFHGVEELGGCSDPCTELASGFEGDLRGDYAADTPPTPRNFSCAPPSGADCEGTAWGPTQVENFMGYAPSSCQTLFTPAQIHRMQCWTQQELSTWASTPIAPCERPLDASTVTLWHLSEGSGSSTTDASASALTAQLGGGVAWAPSACGSSALQFSQPTHTLRLPAAALAGALGAGTIECTLQWSGAAPGAEGSWIVDQSAGAGSSNLGLVLRADGRLAVHVAGAERLVSAATLTPLRWTRVAANWNGARVQLYLDDILNAEVASTAVPAALGADLWVAHSGGTVAGPGAFGGAVDEIRISRIARVVSAPVAAAMPGLELSVSPNPAPGRADLSFSLPRPSAVRVELFDFAGRRVATLHDGALPAGPHRLRWSGQRDDGSRVGAGIFVARVQGGDASDRRTLVWIP